MNFVQITPGAGGMYCGNCFRDNALVAELRQLGHSTLMVPLYLPMSLDEADQSAGTPIFFSGMNVYLEQKSALFRHAPEWLHQALASPRMLKWAAGRAAKTRAADVGELTVSMLRGEEGNQAREVEQLATWLEQQQHPDVIFLSNALLTGMVRELRWRLQSAVVCMLQGEDSFLDALPDAQRQTAWQTLAERARDVDLFIAPSGYFGELMTRRLGLDPARVRVVPNGISVAGYDVAGEAPAAGPPVLGYFARMCREKGLDLLVDAYLRIRERKRAPHVRLQIGGGCGPADEPFVAEMKQRLHQAGALADTTFHPNVSREQKIAFLKSLTVFSVPAHYGEAFGLYLLEAMAAGVPVVQPRVAAFPELVESTGGGLLCAPRSAAALAETIESLLLDTTRRRKLGEAGREAVRLGFTARRMAENIVKVSSEAMANRIAFTRKKRNPA